MSDTLLRWLTGVGPVAGVLAIGVWAFFKGWVHSDPEFKRVIKDLETERAAHQETRNALALSNARSDAGTRAAELIAFTFEEARKRVPTTPAQ